MKKKESNEKKINTLVERKLIESEARYKRITDGLTDYLYTVKVKDGQAVETIHNEACLTVTGYSPKDFAEDPHLWINMVPPDEREKVAKRFLKILSGEDLLPVEHRIICKDGKVRWVIDTTIPKYDSDGKLISYDGVIKVITDRKEAEEALKLRERYLTAIIENQPGLVWLKDINGRFLATNRAFAIACSKNTPDDLIGKNDLDIWPKKLAEKYMTDDAEIILQKKSIHLEEQILDVNQVKWFETFKMPILDDNGNVIGTTGIARDVTERKLTEERLILSENKYREMVEQINDVIFTTDINGTFTYISPAVEVMGGYKPEDMIGHSMYEFTDPEFRSILNEQYAKIFSGVIESTEYKVRTKSGESRWVRSSSRPIILENKPIGLRGVLTDINAQKNAEAALIESEERLRITLEATQIGIWDWNLKNDTWYASPIYYSMLGYESEIGPANRSLWLSRIHPEDRLLVQEKIGEVLLSKLTNYNYEARMLHADGSYRWHQVMGYVIENDYLGNPSRMVGIRRDITERKQSEEIVALSEKRYRDLFEANNDGISIFYINADGTVSNIVDANNRAAEMLGYQKHEIIGMHPSEFEINVPSEDSKRRVEQIKANGYTILETVIKHKNGNCVSVDIRVTQITYNNRPALMSIVRDITERKLAEEALRKSEEKYRGIFENIQDVYYEATLDGTIIELSPSAENFSKGQFRREDLIGKSIANFYADINQRQVFLDTLKEKRELNDYELILKNRDGSSVECSLSSKIQLDANGKPFKIIGSIRDITERRLAEKAMRDGDERFRKAFVVSPDSININRIFDGVYIQINQGFSRIMGYTEEEVIGKSSLDLNIWKNPEDRQKLVEGLKKHGFVENLEAEFCAKDGSIIHGLMSATIIEIDNEKLILNITRDVTDRKLIEAELKKYRDHLEELVKERTEELHKANLELTIKIEKEKEFELMLQKSLEKEKELSEMKSRFISTTSHEFRTPLTTVLTSTELIQRYAQKWSEEKKNEHLERIKSSVIYLTKLLDDVLTISRTETGKINYNPELIDLYEFANECALETKAIISREHYLKLNFKSEQKKFLLDVKLMKFIFNNLLSNAAKYSPQGGTVELSIYSDEKLLSVEVIDEGIGIPIEETDKIFDSFYRSKNAENIPGTGLGLAIVKRAVELHDGTITVRSEIGKGTTFVVKIPLDSTTKK